MDLFCPSIATIDLSAIARNMRGVRERVGPGVRVLAVVKSDGYGHGLAPVARRLSRAFDAERGAEADAFGVSFVHEGLTLREAGLTEPVLVLGGCAAGEEEALLEYSLTPLVSSREELERLALAGKEHGREIAVHLKVDTGMSRLGMPAGEALVLAREFAPSPFITVQGVATHLAFAFQKDNPKDRRQLEAFGDFVRRLKRETGRVSTVHACNSAGIFAHPDAHYDMVRAGIVLYGSSPFDYSFPGLDLRQAMSWETSVRHLRTLGPGDTVSYGGRFTAERKTRAAVIPVGYSHGLNRALSGKFQCLIRGKRVPQVGTICMDFTVLDVTEVENCGVGERVLILGSEGGEEISASEMAERMGSIPYEVYCLVGRLAARRYAG